MKKSREFRDHEKDNWQVNDCQLVIFLNSNYEINNCPVMTSKVCVTCQVIAGWEG